MFFNRKKMVRSEGLGSYAFSLHAQKLRSLPSETFGSHPARQQARKGLTVSPLQVPPRTRNDLPSQFPILGSRANKIFAGVH